MKKNTENLDPNCNLWNELLEWSKTKTNNEILEVFSDSDWWLTFFNYCENHGIERKDGKKLWYKNCMDTSAVYIDKEGREYKLYSSGADFHEDVWAAAEYAFVEISEDTEQQQNPEKDDGLEWKQINWMWNYRIYERLWGLLVIIDDNDKYWVINLKWEKIVECEYDSINSYWIMRKWDKYWLISKTWEIIKSVRYDRINWSFHNKTFLVQIDWKRWIIDEQWNKILDCTLIYDCVENSGKWTYRVQKDWKYGIIDNNGGLILPVQYDYVYERYDKWGYSVSLDWKEWFINDKWQLIIPIKYDEILKQSKGDCYKVKLNWNRWILDSTGWEILPIQYEEVDVISKWKYKVKSDWVWKIVDNKWETIKELQYKNSEELDRWVNKVESGDDFENEYIGKYRKYWLVDRHWREILPLQYSQIQKISKWIYIVRDREFIKWVVDKNWVEIIPVIYEDLRVLKTDRNLLLAKNKSWKYWIINTKNEIIVPFEFDMIREEYVKTWILWKKLYNIYVQKDWKTWQLVL